MADTFIKRPVLYKGTKAQIESATMGENDFAVATDVEFYTKEEINSLLGEGTTFEVQVVNSLPATGAKGVIYLVPKDGAAPDVHDEYVWIESTSTFELIGTTQIDLTGYVKNTDYASVSTGGAIKISNYYGSHIFGDGKIAAVSASLETYKSAPSEYFIGKATLENAKNDIVKRAITGNDIVLTDEEKTSAQTWLGVARKYATQDTVSNVLSEKVNIAQGVENAGKILTIDNDGNVVVGEGGGASLPILMSMWADRVINDMSWLRADTFSWHTGDVYVAAYQHLVSDINNGKLYAWNNGVGTIYTRKLSVVAQDNVYNSAGEKIAYVKYTGDGYIAYDNVPENYFYRAESSDITGVAPEQATDTIGDTTITYYQADDGHKICLPDQESNLAALYEATGVAWYYVLDTENKQFKLPRTKWGFTGLRDGVGGMAYTASSGFTPDYSTGPTTIASGWVAPYDCVGFCCRQATNNNTCSVRVDGKLVYYGWGSEYTDAVGAQWFVPKGSTVTFSGAWAEAPQVYKTKVVNDNTPATQMYLYFYVGNFEQSALEQTAGFTSEILNATVADIDLGNITATGKSTVSNLCMPSEKATTLTAGASGTVYTAPANGYFVAEFGTTATQAYTALLNTTVGSFGYGGWVSVASANVQCFTPARKGDTVKIFVTNAKCNWIKFFYAEGEK